MKNIYLKLILLSGIMYLYTSTTKACVDYHPIPPSVTVKIDSAWTKFELTAHELNIFAGSTGAFCTCGLSAFGNLFDYIYYVAFVDSGTTNEINGFAPWTNSNAATNAWASASPGSWSGFVAAVINNMTPGLPVELIIKADLPAGYVSTWQFDSSLSVSYLGTDEWDNNQNTLANSHFSISGFGAATYEIVSPDYFTSIQENAINNDNINIFPNPGNGIFHISSNLQDSDTDLEIINLLGNIIYTCKLNTNRMKIDINHQKAGIYFIRIKRNKETILNKKIIIVD